MGLLEPPPAREAEISALERAMGVMGVDDEGWDGEIDEDDQDGDGRSPPVVYGDDALFEDAASPEEGPSAAAALSSLLDGQGGGGGADSTATLIAYLEQMAAGLEAQSGEEETEIRGKIAVLRSVLEMRAGAVQQQLERLEVAGRAGAAEGGADDGGALAALQAVADESVERIEEGMGAVETLLQDEGARRLLAESAPVWMPAIVAAQDGGAAPPAARNE